MPNVGSYELTGHDGSNWVTPTYVKGNDGSSWQYGISVYYHNGTDWVEVWNARPVAVSTSMSTTSSTGLSFSGTADPNNFLTTAKFEYKEVGAGSYSNSGTTTTGMGDGVDGAVSYTVTATVSDSWKNWEARASATNTAGTGTGSTVTLDCRKHNAGGSGWGTSDSSNSSTCDGCGTVTTRTYTKSGCQTYTGTISTCGTWSNYTEMWVCIPVSGGSHPYVYSSLWGWAYSDGSSCGDYIDCGGGYILIAENVQVCSSSGAYRVTGTDLCIYPSI